MKYLLDTNTCIYIIKGNPKQVGLYFRTFPTDVIAVSAITVAELQFGIAKSSIPGQNQEALSEFLLPLTVLPFDEKAAAHYGVIRATLQRKGLIIGAMDMLIGAQALSLGMTVVTNNVREFARIDNLTVENWVI